MVDRQMGKQNTRVARSSINPPRALSDDPENVSMSDEVRGRWRSDVDRARKLVAIQIIESVETKWGTAAAVERATGISQTEISRIRNGKFARFSLDRLVWLLWVVDRDVEVALRVEAKRKKPGRPRSSR